MSLDQELDPARIERLQAIRMGAPKVQTPAWLREALVDTLDMIDEMVARRHIERDAIEVIRELVAKREVVE